MGVYECYVCLWVSMGFWVSMGHYECLYGCSWVYVCLWLFMSVSRYFMSASIPYL